MRPIPNTFFDGSGGGAPFDPSSIANMVYWFDPSDPSTITLGGSGDVNVLADKLGNWVMYAGGVASRQPVLETINGVVALRYHAWPDSDYLKLADVQLTYYASWSNVYSVPTWTHFVVLEAVGNCGPATNTWQTTGLQDESGYNGFYGNGGTPMKFRCYYYATVAPVDAYVEFTEPAGPGVPMQLMSKMTGPGAAPATGTLSASRDGGAYSTVVSGQLYQMALNINQGVGYTFGANAYFDGRIGETLSYNRELTAPEVTQVTDYLRTKWNLP